MQFLFSFLLLFHSKLLQYKGTTILLILMALPAATFLSALVIITFKNATLQNKASVKIVTTHRC